MKELINTIMEKFVEEVLKTPEIDLKGIPKQNILKNL